MTSAISYQIANLLEKMGSADKDFRFMATNDLMSELQKDSIKLDDDSERKVVRTLLKLLEDKNGEVQNLAVKCLGPLVNKVKENQVESIVDTLCANMVNDNEQLRDVSSVGLKTVISELPTCSHPLTSNVCRKVTPRLVCAIQGQVRLPQQQQATSQSQQNVDVAIQLEGLDILSDLLLRYGGLLAQFHANIQEALMPLLASPRLAVRKRAIVALSHLVSVCSQPLFQTLSDYLFDALEKNQTLSTTRTYVACVGAVSRAAGPRFGSCLPKLIPLLMKYCDMDDDELREGCLQSFESILLRCPKESTPYVADIVQLCSKYLCHDPNYHYDADEGGECERMDVENGDTDLDGDGRGDDASEDDDQEYSDDDDMSWKVRRASAKCLEAILSTRTEMLPEFYRQTSPLLISRFKEREENVKADVFKAYIALLKHTKLAVPSGDLAQDDRGLLQLLDAQLPLLIKAVTRHLKEKSPKTRQCCFALLTELMKVSNGCLSASDRAGLLLPGIQRSLTDKQANSNMKIDTLQFLCVALSSHPAKTFQPYIYMLVPLIVNAVDDPFYKVTAEALAVVQQLIRILRPADTPSSSFDFTPHVSQLHKAVFNKLKATDIDQEVKERAISCMGYLLATFGDYLQAELPSCLPLLLDRLKNEVTRLTTVRALTSIAQSPLKISLNSILPSAVNDLAEFLRKNQRALRVSTLQLLDTLNLNYQSALTPPMLRKVLGELPALINESDLQIAQMTLALLTNMLKFQPEVVEENIKQILSPPVSRLILSPLLQGPSLTALMNFLCQLLLSGSSKLSFEQLRQLLTKSICESSPSSPVAKQAFYSAAKCLAALVAAIPQEAPAVVAQLTNDLNAAVTEQPVHLFSLLALGEIGRVSPKATSDTVPPIDQIIMKSFQSNNEEIKTAASLALGGVAVGNLEKYLPIVLREIETQAKRQYLLLHALKEIISSESTMNETDMASSIFKPHIDQIWTVLVSHADCNEEGVRNVVAECLGKLCLLEPERLLPKLKNHLVESNSPLTRATIVTAVKFTIIDQPQAIDPLLKTCIGDFLQTLTDPDLNVRRVALTTFNSTAHNKPSLIKGDLLTNILPYIYCETKMRRELVREVEMGPFKHTVDDGLDLRKAAFECMYTLLETCLERVDIFEFLTHVEDGLKDHYDIKMLTYLMLIRLASLCPTQTLQRLDRLVDPLKQTCLQRMKPNSVKQEYEKQDELKRCALRAVSAVQVIAEADKNPQLHELLCMIKMTPELNSLYESVQKDNVHMSYGYEMAAAQPMEVDAH